MTPTAPEGSGVDAVFGRVVVGIDGSPAALDACRHAVRLADPGCPVDAVTVVHLAEAVHTGLNAPRVVDLLQEEADRAVAEAQRILLGRGHAAPSTGSSPRRCCTRSRTRARRCSLSVPTGTAARRRSCSAARWASCSTARPARSSCRGRWTSPLAVIQVLLVNLVTDGLPALALARDPASPETMLTPPRVGRELFDRHTWRRLMWIGALVGAATFAAFAIGRELGGDVAQTMAFTTLALSELALVYGMRSPSVPAWRMPANRWLDLGVAVSAVVVVGVVYVPGLHGAFATVPLGPVAAAVAGGLALVPLAGVELRKLLLRTEAAPA